jgi:hypothetical protein
MSFQSEVLDTTLGLQMLDIWSNFFFVTVFIIVRVTRQIFMYMISFLA